MLGHNDNRSLCAEVGHIARHIGVGAPQFVVILKCFVWIVTSATGVAPKLYHGGTADSGTHIYTRIFYDGCGTLKWSTSK